MTPETWNADLDHYAVRGGCWCADTRTVAQLRHMGHDARCTQARRGWAANFAHLRAVERQRREDERVGRELRLGSPPTELSPRTGRA